MRTRSVRRALLRRLDTAHPERGSIPLLLLVMLLAAAFGGVLMSSIITQSQTTHFTQTRVHSLDAAQAGVDYALGQIRSAYSTVGAGDDSTLPCGPWSSQAADSNGSSTFTASVKYFVKNPATLTSAQLGDASTPGTAQMVCASTAGPYDTASSSRTPRYALITGKGLDGSNANESSTGRTLQTTYVFKTNDANVSGGLIRLYPSGTNSQWCMDAGSSPAAGTAVKLQACSTSTPPDSAQVWTYRADLSIELVSSATSNNPLCIDTSPVSHAAGDAIVLARCAVADSSVCPAGMTPAKYASTYPGKSCAVSTYDQQWSVDDNAHLRGANSAQTDVDGYCINAGSQGANVALTLQACAGGTTDTAQTWVPAPTTGAGMAGAGNQQLVNYKQFATCLDVTGQQVSATFLILYTCKQNPDPTKVAFNQKFTPSPALGVGPTQVLLTTTTGGTTYCLRSPQTLNGYPTLSTPCPSSPSGAYAWTVSQVYTSGTKSAELTYADKYTIKDSSTAGPQGAPLCLGPGPNSDLYSGQYYKVVVTGCDGSTSQKWNADASLDAATVTNVHEVTPSGS